MQKVCKEWLSTGKYVLVCKPFPSLKSDEKGVDRSKLPEMSATTPSSFPNLQKETLKNGLNVIMAQRKGVPTIVGKLVFNAGSDLDASYLNFTTLQQTFDPTLDLFAEILLNPSFPQKEFDRLKKEHLDRIDKEKSQPFGMALRVFPKVLYGEGNAYSNPIYGSGYESTVKSITPEEIQKFYNTWIRPNNATLIVVGDVQMADLVARLESKLAG